MQVPSPPDNWLQPLFDFLDQFGNRIQGFDAALSAIGLIFAFLGSLYGLFRWLHSRRSAHKTVVDARHQLRPPDPLFVGRKAELTTLDRQVRSDGARIVGIFGMGGIGKTAIARALAHRLARRFRDAQIEIDLGGFGPDTAPLAVDAIYAHAIRAFDPAADTDRPTNQLAATFMALTRDQRGILILDNVRDQAQIEAIALPPTWLLIVTSRERIHLPMMVSQDLAALPRRDAVKLLRKAAPRVGAHADAFADLLQGLPLALRAAAGTLASSRALAPEVYLTSLRAVGGRLDPVAAALKVSIEALPADLRSRWYALSVFPADFSAEAAAAIWGLMEPADPGDDESRESGIGAAAVSLADLERASLVEYASGTDRFRLHDLARDYAVHNCPPEVAYQAAARHATYTQDLLAQIEDLYTKGDQHVTEALAWFDREWPGIEAGQNWASTHAETDRKAARLAIAFPEQAFELISLRVDPRTQVAWWQAALPAAQYLDDRDGESAALNGLAILYGKSGEPRRAIELHEQALAINRQRGNRRGEASVLTNLGISYHSVSETRRAIDLQEQSLVIFRELSDRFGQASVLVNLGNCYAALGDLRRAVELYEEALLIERELGDRRGEASTLGNLSNHYDELGEPRQAIEFAWQELYIAREIGDRDLEASALRSLGNAYKNAKQVVRGIEYLDQALAIYRERGDRSGEAATLSNQGNCRASLDDWRQAVDLWHQAATIDHQIGNRRREAVHLFNLAVAHEQLGDASAAIRAAESSLLLRQAIEDPEVQHTRDWLERLRVRLAQSGLPVPVQDEPSA
jgi:tetratricopeptide (TPR) repeat protein